MRRGAKAIIGEGGREGKLEGGAEGDGGGVLGAAKGGEGGGRGQRQWRWKNVVQLMNRLTVVTVGVSTVQRSKGTVRESFTATNGKC